jgi:hypothetical protein
MLTRARDARGRRRRSLGGDGVSGTAARDAALNVDMSDPAAKRSSRNASHREGHRAGAAADETVDGDAAAYDAKMEKLLTDLALMTKALRDLQRKKAMP